MCHGAVQTNNIPPGGLRYGIGQAFGYDLGLGILRDTSFVAASGGGSSPTASP